MRPASAMTNRNGHSAGGPRVRTDQLRQKYQPKQIRVLFVGESPPAGGNFFYAGTGNLFKYTKEAFRNVYRIAAGADFRRTFQAAGCYLEDLCPEPVNQSTQEGERQDAREHGVRPLSKKVARMAPDVIIPLLKGIEPCVRRAAEAAGLLKRLRPALPFPAMGHQPRYVRELSCLLDELREASILPRELSQDTTS
jgi:hypothetical protein